MKRWTVSGVLMREAAMAAGHKARGHHLSAAACGMVGRSKARGTFGDASTEIEGVLAGGRVAPRLFVDKTADARLVEATGLGERLDGRGGGT